MYSAIGVPAVEVVRLRKEFTRRRRPPIVARKGGERYAERHGKLKRSG